MVRHAWTAPRGKTADRGFRSVVASAFLALALILVPRLAHAADCTLYPLQGTPKSTGAAFKLADAVTVESTGVVTSDCLDLTRAGYFGVAGSCTGSAPDVELTWQESPIRETGDFAETTVIAANVTGTITPASFAPPPMRYGRLVLTGNAGNGADTVCSVWVLIQGPGA